MAGIAEIVKLVEALASNALSISVSEMAELIEKDVVVCTKVISAANTLGYNPSAAPVSSISQAIHVIGFSKIRMLSMSLLLMENAERNIGATAQRETSTLALTSGMMAQAWAEGQGRRDCDEAFLCASLRNFGRLLMTALLADDYRQAQADASTHGDADAAYRAIFGTTPLELGYELLKSANLPEALLLGLRQFTPQMLDVQVLDPATELLVAAEFSVRLAQLVLRPSLSPAAYAEQSRALLRQFGKHLRIDLDTLNSVFERSEHRMSAFGQAFGLQAMSRSVTAKVAARRLGKPAPSASDLLSATVPSPEAAAEGTAAGTECVVAANPATEGAAVRPADAAPIEGVARAAEPGLALDGIVASMAVEALAAVVPAGGMANLALEKASPAVVPTPAERRPLIEILHETVANCAELLSQSVVNEELLATPIAVALLEGWAADEVVILLERGKGSFVAVAGAGTRWREYRAKVGFRRDERNVLGVSAARCEPVLIHDASDPKIDPYLPAWLKGGLQLYSCIIVPGGAAPAAHSLVFAGWRVRQKVSLGMAETRSIRALLGMVITARRLGGL